MELSIIKGSIEDITDCQQALEHSVLGERYFSNPGSARRALEEGFGKDQIFVALSQGQCVGFVWIVPDGAFHGFPYIHIIAVKQEYRSQGIGKGLLQFAEDHCFTEDDKLFLVVADFNPQAKKLYEEVGYTQVGTIPSLYREGITEYLMMKKKGQP